jgi:flagellar assembly protein FliH
MAEGFLPADVDLGPAAAVADEVLAVTFASLTPTAASLPREVPSGYSPDLEPAPAPDLELEAALARAEGERQGYQDGMSMARQQAEALGAALAQAEASRAEQMQAACQRLEAEAVQLAFEMAQMLMAHHLSAHPDSVLAVIRGALDEVAEAEEVHLLLHPDDLELIGAQAERLAMPGARLHLRPDPGLERGGCRVESDAGDVDATREGRTSRLRARLGEVLAEGQGPSGA